LGGEQQLETAANTP